MAELDPVVVARAARFGGGPGGPAALDDLRLRRAAIAAEMADRIRRWRRADLDLATAVAALSGRRADGPAVILAEAGHTA